MYNMKNKILGLTLCITLMLSLLIGCRNAEVNNSINPSNTSQKNQLSSSINETATDENSDSKKNVRSKKKIFVVQEQIDSCRNDIQKNIVDTIQKAGYTKPQGSEIIQIQMNGDENNSTNVIDSILREKPDVVVINNTTFSHKSVAKKLEGVGIPIVLTLNIDNKEVDFIDDKGQPKSNITGVRGLFKNAQKNSYILLNKICPINGKKAVFLTSPGRFDKDEVITNLLDYGVECKDYVETKYLEEYQDAMLKYNNDPEVGWILVGLWPAKKKDGTAISNLVTGYWDVTHRKKPSCTYNETAVASGILCALAMDLPDCGTQAAQMATKILNGEKVENVTAEYPRKTHIVINLKAAKDLNVTIPADIIGSAKIYMDYKSPT